MSQAADSNYFAGRAVTERALAEAADTPTAKSAHNELAERYAQLVEDEKAARPVCLIAAGPRKVR